jgi:predicted RNA binding protein YcfA (HicA-like mRNA interferase family)
MPNFHDSLGFMPRKKRVDRTMKLGYQQATISFDHRIVKITRTTGARTVLYQHPKYNFPGEEIELIAKDAEKESRMARKAGDTVKADELKKKAQAIRQQRWEK